MTEPSLRALLERHAKAPLGVIPSRIETCANLSRALGISLSVKRDDTFALAMGGNKVRQLEYYLGPAVAQGADTVLITGAVQSNFVRLCVAAARKLGMKPVAQVEHRVARQDPLYATSGNMLLNRMMGAEIHHLHDIDSEAAADANLDAIAATHRAKGRAPYVVHLGLDHAPTGALGYVEAAIETYAQCTATGDWPDVVVLASGSGITHAGFLAGARALGWDVPVHGICVRRDAVQQRSRIRQRTGETMALLGADAVVGDADIILDDSVLPPGYGMTNDAVREAITLAAQQEGMMLDPVYTGRTMAGLVAQTRSGMIARGARVLMIHTGGLPGIFAYQSDLNGP